jgi:hypothetical protein
LRKATLLTGSFLIGVTSLFGAEEPSLSTSEKQTQSQELTHQHLHIPEPMIFDLVRGLGARQGEFEVNVLGEFPLNHASSRHIEWAPEIEVAILNGVALEFELPFEDGKLEAYKSALQWTFGQSKSGHFIHGIQFIGEKTRNKDLWEGSLLYIPAYRFSETWSTVALLGARREFGSDSPHETTTLLANATVFPEVTRRTTLGLELNYAYPNHPDEEGAGWKLLAMPQAQYQFTDHWSTQAGVGAEFTGRHINATAAVRMIFTY